jgi:hypothetical protein
MTLDDFLASVKGSSPPEGVPTLARALWHDARGDWDTAHRIAQDDESAEGAWVHAYLHRREGDLGNAAYWYGRAGRPQATDALDAEWRRIATALLA